MVVVLVSSVHQILLFYFYQTSAEESGVLQFGGGCKGCSMIDLTLKQSIEKSLRNKFSEIVLIKDATNHAEGKNPFCK